MSDKRQYGMEALSQAVAYIKSKVPYTPQILLIAGSGLNLLTDIIQDPILVNYEDIPNFPKFPPTDLPKQLVFGTIANVKIMCMKTRLHYYEGFTLEETTVPVKIAKLLGINFLLVTNAAGSCNPNYKAGDVMIIKDHVNFLGMGGNHPFIGPNIPELGPRFFAVNDVYDKNVINNAKKIAKEMGFEQNIHEGVYAMVGGPNYESVAEVKLMRVVGVDAVGMSTVTEIMAAAHANMKVFGFSLISNEGIAEYNVDKAPNHEEVLKMVNARATVLKDFVFKLIGTIQLPCKCFY